MILRLRTLLARYQAPVTGEGDDLPGGAAVVEDYGNDFEPAGGDDATAAKDKHTPAKKPGESESTDDAKDAKDAKDKPAEGEDEGDEDDGGSKEGTLREGAQEEQDGAGDKKDTGTPKTGKGKFIPLDRHEKMLRKERARREELEAQLAQGRAGQAVAKTHDALEKIENDLVGMEEKYNDLLAEGDTKAAAHLMTEIRRKNAELNAVSAEQRDAEVMARAVEKVRYDEALDRVEEAYPVLDPDSDDYDEDLYQDVVDLMQAGQRRGLSPTKSLQRAVQRVMGADTGAQKRATTVTPRVDENDVAGDLAAKRRSDAVKRNVDAAQRTPPVTQHAGAGNDSAGGALTAKAVMAMDEADFAKLSDKDLSRLRGDTL